MVDIKKVEEAVQKASQFIKRISRMQAEVEEKGEEGETKKRPQGGETEKEEEE
jgi:hypothetical protein